MPAAIIENTEKVSLYVVAGQVSKAKRIEIILVEAAVRSPSQDVLPSILMPIVDDSVWIQIEVIKLELPSFEETSLVPLRDVVVNV